VIVSPTATAPDNPAPVKLQVAPPRRSTVSLGFFGTKEVPWTGAPTIKTIASRVDES
jgi:hypothetical protein